MEDNNLYHKFAITYNKNYRKNAKMQEGDYAEVIMTLNDHCKLEAYSFERGDIQKRLHLHAFITMTQEQQMYVEQNNIFSHKGFCFKMIECYDHHGWLNYMAKEKSFFTG